MYRIINVVLLFTIVCITDIQCNCSSYKMLYNKPLSCAIKETIIKEHNRLRQMIAGGKVNGLPTAANMAEMVWDDELAKAAQRWANKCSDNHDPNRKLERYFFGQNLATTWTSQRPKSPIQPDFIGAIKSWFSEVNLYQPYKKTRGTGHFTQIIWATTSHVGCGFNSYYDPWRGYVYNYVCNYGPSGNIRGYNMPYTVGQPACDRFGMLTSYDLFGLCKKDVSYPLGKACARF